ncbi:hypothetical protein ABQF33_07940 [Mycolicibacterium sp. XJ2]
MMRPFSGPSALRFATARYHFRESLFALPALVLVIGIAAAELLPISTTSSAWTLRCR